MATSAAPSDIALFLTNVAWATCSIYHMVIKASPGMAIFGRDMLFNIPYIADWNNIWDYRQHQTDLNAKCENISWIDYYYKVGGKVLVQKDGILLKTESWYDSDHGQSRQFIQMAQSG